MGVWGGGGLQYHNLARCSPEPLMNIRFDSLSVSFSFVFCTVPHSAVLLTPPLSVKSVFYGATWSTNAAEG